MAKLRTFALLPVAEKWLLLQALYWLAYYRYNLRRHKQLKRIFIEVEERTSREYPQVRSALPAQRVCRLITSAAKYIPFSTCFSKALAGRTLLARHGCLATLRIGVVKDSATKLAAHAWLTLGDEIILNDLPDIHKYTEIPLESIDYLSINKTPRKSR